MIQKICKTKNGCGKNKSISEFNRDKSRNDGYSPLCKECKSVQDKTYAINNKEKIKITRNIYTKNNKIKILSRQQRWYQANRERILEEAKERRERPENKEKRNLNEKNRQENDILYRLKTLVSRIVGNCLKNRGTSKSSTFKEYLPYSQEILKNHLENLFEPWMNWKNWGRYDPKTWNDDDSTTWKWQLDHIIPISDFEFLSEKDQAFKDCWALSNLRPLSAKQNVLDGVRRVRHKKKENK